MSRIDARIPLSVRETIDRAAAMQGRTCTDFLIAATREKAEQSLMRLALEDQRTLASTLDGKFVYKQSTIYVILRE